MKVAQVLCAAGPVDATTNQALAWRQLFDSWHWGGADFAAVVAPGMPRQAVRPLRELNPSDGEVLLLHYSGYAPGLERLVGSAARSMLISHNITPPQYFWTHEPVEAVRCKLARTQLAELAGRADAVAGVSEYNALELRRAAARDAEVIPVLFDRARLGPRGGPPPDPPTVLFVGRLVPHKRQDLVIRGFAEYRRMAPGARLVFVGVPLSPAYGEQLRALADALAPGAVTFESEITSASLAARYRAAHAFLCLSEHEGFCIPLLEAFHFGVPVICRDAGAVGEVVGDAAVLLGDEDDIFTVAHLLRIVIEDAELRAEMRDRGERRLEAYDYGRTAQRLRQALSGLASA